LIQKKPLSQSAESLETPKSVIHGVEGPNKLGKEIRRDPSLQVDTKRFVRRLQVGLLLDVNHAETIANFILERIKDHRAKSGKSGS
jgi:hypothetical protein